MIVKPQTCVLYRGEVKMVRKKYCTEVPLIEVLNWQSLTKDETPHFYSHTSLGIRTCVLLSVGDDFSVLFSYIISLFFLWFPIFSSFHLLVMLPQIVEHFWNTFAEVLNHEAFTWLIHRCCNAEAALRDSAQVHRWLRLFCCCSGFGGFCNDDGMAGSVRWERNPLHGQVHRQLAFLSLLIVKCVVTFSTRCSWQSLNDVDGFA